MNGENPFLISPIVPNVPKVRVLVVDDEPSCLDFTTGLLKLYNYQVTAAKDPLHALTILHMNKGSFDLVISDIYMPLMNGVELQQKVEQEYKIPVILMTEVENDMQKITEETGLEERSLVMVKPPSITEIQDMGHFVLSRTKARKTIRRRKPRSDNNDVLTANPTIPDQNNDKGKSPIVAADVSGEDGGDEAEDATATTNDSDKSKKARKKPMNWTSMLHNKFLNAIKAIGYDRAIPKKILEHMNMPGLTREHIASHLQKYRIYMKKLFDACSKAESGFLLNWNQSPFLSRFTWHEFPDLIHNSFLLSYATSVFMLGLESEKEQKKRKKSKISKKKKKKVVVATTTRSRGNNAKRSRSSIGNKNNYAFEVGESSSATLSWSPGLSTFLNLNAANDNNDINSGNRNSDVSRNVVADSSTMSDSSDSDSDNENDDGNQDADDGRKKNVHRPSAQTLLDKLGVYLGLLGKNGISNFRTLGVAPYQGVGGHQLYGNVPNHGGLRNSANGRHNMMMQQQSPVAPMASMPTFAGQPVALIVGGASLSNFVAQPIAPIGTMSNFVAPAQSNGISPVASLFNFVDQAFSHPVSMPNFATQPSAPIGNMWNFTAQPSTPMGSMYNFGAQPTSYMPNMSGFYSQQPTSVGMSNFAGQQPCAVNMSDFVEQPQQPASVDNMPNFVGQGQPQLTGGSVVNTMSDFMEQQPQPIAAVIRNMPNFVAQPFQIVSPMSNLSNISTDYQQGVTSNNVDNIVVPPEQMIMPNNFNTTFTQVVGNQGNYSSSSSNDLQRVQGMQGYGFTSGSSGHLEDWATVATPNPFGDYSTDRFDDVDAFFSNIDFEDDGNDGGLGES